MRYPPRVFEKYVENYKPETFLKWLDLFDNCHKEKYGCKVDVSFPVSSEIDATEVDYLSIEEFQSRYMGRYSERILNKQLNYQCYINRSKVSDNLMIRLLLYKVPRLEIEIDERMKQSEMGLYTEDYVDFILSNNLADLVVDFSSRFKGNKSALYLFLKSLTCKRFDKFSNSKTNKDDSYVHKMLLKIRDVFADNGFVTVDDENNSITQFLRGCDQRLITDFGEDNMEVLLGEMNISLKKWLT